MKQNNNNFLEEAIRIGDDILSHKLEERQGFFWKTMSLDKDKNISWDVSESIYSGVGGIVLFFIELYKQTADENYLEAAIKGTDWLIDHAKNNTTSYYAFFTGRMGLTYVFIQMYHLTQEEEYVNEAIRTALHCTDFLQQTNLVDDLINGTSGSLLGLLLLHQETKEEKLLPLIEQFVSHLIHNTYHGPKGLYWDKNTRQMQGLCGFSHGASGLGYVFLQLGEYFNNPSFFWVAEQAFLYENHFFDEQTRNWPDFRKGIFSEEDYEEHKQAFVNRNADFFFKPQNMLAWCHGAPGIGLSRLYAWQLLKKEYAREDVYHALISTRRNTLSPQKQIDTFSLCHGKGGNAMLFLEVYKRLGKEEVHHWAQKTALQALDFRAKYGYYRPGFISPKKNLQDDISLFMGNAGVGYFYLMCVNPEKVPSILAPSIDGICECEISSSFDFLNITFPQIKKMILTRAYPRTLSLIEHQHLKVIESFFDKEYSNTMDLKSVFEDHVQYSLYDGSDLELNHLKTVFDLEKKKLDVELHTNPCLQHIKTMILDMDAEQLCSLSKERLLETELKMNDDVIIYEYNDLESPQVNKNQHNTTDRQSIVLFRSSQGVEEYPVSTFTQEILKAFTKPKKTWKVKKGLSKQFDLSGHDWKLKFEELIVDQVRECIRSQMLIRT